MIRPVKLEIENFCLIKSATINFNSPDFYYIDGKYVDHSMGEISNGAGKSSLLNALWYALTGNLIQKVTYGDIIGPFSSHMTTAITLKDETNTYRIERGRQRKGILEFYINDERVTSIKNPSATEERIAETFGVNWELFKHTNYLPQDDARTSFIYANNSVRREILNSLYNKEVFVKILNHIKKRLKEYRVIFYTIQEDVLNCHGQIQGCESVLTSLRNEIKTSHVRNKVRSDQDRIVIEQNIKALNKEILDLDIKYDNSKINVKTLKKQVKVLRIAVNKEKYKQDKTVKKLNIAEYDIGSSMSQIKELKQTIRNKSECPVCKQALSSHAVSHCKKQVNILISECKNKIKMETSLKDELEKFSGDTIKSEKILNDYMNIEIVAAIDNRQKVKFQAVYAKQRLQAAIDSLEAEVPVERDIESLITIRTDTKLKLKALYVKLKAHETALASAQYDIDQLEVWELAYAHEMPAMAFESIVDQFAALVSAKLSLMYGSTLHVRFDTKTSKPSKMQDKFVCQIRDADVDNWRDVSMASGGQKRILTLAIALTMQDMSSAHLGIMLMDENLENLDPIATKAGLDILKRSSRSHVILFVTHDTNLIPDGQRKITAIRQNGCIEFI